MPMQNGSVSVRPRRWSRWLRYLVLPAFALGLQGLLQSPDDAVASEPPASPEPRVQAPPTPPAAAPEAPTAPAAEAPAETAAAVEPVAAPPPTLVREKVIVGAYINDIQNLDLKTHTYAADIYLWFRWTNAAFDPSATMDFVNPYDLWGHVRTIDNDAPVVFPEGTFTQVVRAQGRFSCKLPLYDYPLDHQVLFIEFEDRNLDISQMTYVADSPSIDINPDITLPGMTVGVPRLVVSNRKYSSNFGDMRGGRNLEFSRARIELPMSRPVVPHLIKMLLPVVCVVLCASMMFLFRPNYVDSRVELGITSLLTVVALQMTLNQDLPDVAYLVLVDKVYVATYLYVMAGIAVVVKTTNMNDDGNALGAARLNRVGMLAATAVYFSTLGLLIVPKLV